ncbi:MAG: hypothetical protein RSB71_02370 [Bacilli bacterium]
MSKKLEAAKLIADKLRNKTFLTYKEIAVITDYHPKYILKLKKEILDGNISFVHGNKNKEPINKMDDKEKAYIINLYKRSNASVRKFCKFYNRRSYSCVYTVLKEAKLIKDE